MQKEDAFAEVNERRRIRLENEKKKNESTQIIAIVNEKKIELLMPSQPIKETFHPFYINKPIIEKVVEKKKVLTSDEQQILNNALTEEKKIIESLIDDVSFEAVNKRRDARKKREAIEKELFGSN
jgi:hypothetical protein